MHGPPGSGKTALAALIAKNSEFPFGKLLSPENLVQFSERSKVNYLSKVQSFFPCRIKNRTKFGECRPGIKISLTKRKSYYLQ